MADTKGRATGFDYLRIILAAGVILWHAFTTSYGNPWAYGVLASPARVFVVIILPMFFALSGFLVAGSLFRNPAVSTFIGLRMIRIYPALAVEVLLSAIVLGPLLTTFPLGAYFRDPAFFKYLLNISGHIHFQLPGLFAKNPIPFIVNSQLWTVQWELICYISLTSLWALKIVRNRMLYLLVVIIGTIAVLGLALVKGHGHIDISKGMTGEPLVFGFLGAVAVYLYRDKLPWSAVWFGGALALTVALLLVPGGDYLVGFPAAYVTVYLGLLNPAKVGILKGADYSYGLYLYGFVIQQALVAIFPWIAVWYLNFAGAMILGSLFAAGSWHFIEKPALKARRFLPHVEERFSSLRPKWFGETGSEP